MNFDQLDSPARTGWFTHTLVGTLNLARNDTVRLFTAAAARVTAPAILPGVQNGVLGIIGSSSGISSSTSSFFSLLLFLLLLLLLLLLYCAYYYYYYY